MKDRFETFTLLISRINRSIRRIKTEEMAEYNLKAPHVSCIYYLYKEGELTAKELCDICDEDKSGISRSIDYLEKEGFVCCEDVVGKRYKSPLRLTEKGMAIAKSLQEKVDRVLGLSSEGLSLEELEKFYDSLTLISENLVRLCEEK